jgi:pre-mRNA-processing factor SLU7
MSTLGKVSKEEFRRQKDLDAARKAGTAPAAVDEDGNAINPHIPHFMVQAPWYLDTGKPSLKHQRKPEEDNERLKFNEWYQRGQKDSKTATKYRKGACENCGAISHKTRDCLERPRKKGAKWSNKNIAADDLYQDLKGVDNDYEVKRDRWNGYDPTEHKKVIQEYEAVEEARRKLREEEIDKQTSTDLSTAKKLARKQKKSKKEGGPTSDGDFGSSDSDEEDEDKYAEKASMVGQKIDTAKRITVRNLRIREDRAKYLYNLNTNSAFYDPKTRSMREAPDPNIRPEDAQFAGDNFERSKGDVAKMQQLQMFAWQSEARGNDIHLQANPTVNELQHREYQQKKEKLNQQMKGSILEKYGGSEHFDNVPKELLTGQSEQYTEYSRTGQPMRSSQRSLQSSSNGAKADEDGKKETLFDGNHKSPFASWTESTTGKDGYECCHSTVKNSYCTGEAGREAQEASNILGKGKAKAIEAAPVHHEEEKKSRTRERSYSSSSSSFSSSSRSLSDSDYSSDRSADSRQHRSKRSSKHVEGYQSKKNIGEGDVASRLDKAKLRSALAEEDRRKKASQTEEGEDNKPDWLKEAESINKKRGAKFASLQGGTESSEVTEEQLEAYRLKNNNNAEDPMANYRDQEE